MNIVFGIGTVDRQLVDIPMISSPGSFAADLHGRAFPYCKVEKTMLAIHKDNKLRLVWITPYSLKNPLPRSARVPAQCSAAIVRTKTMSAYWRSGEWNAG